MKRHSGFSMIEVLLTFSILAVATTALGLTELSNARRSQELKARDIAFARAQAFVERMLRMPFGTPNPTNLGGYDYDRIFGSDGDVTSYTLTQLERRDLGADGVIDEGPIKFRLEGVEDAGEWEIFVDSDLDGNGRVEPTLDTYGVPLPTSEGRTDLLRIEVRRNGKAVIQTLRARSPQERDAEELGG